MAKVTWKGVPVELVGPELKVGDRAPADFTVTARDLRPVKGAELAGKPRILLTSPSLDTPVCDVEARRYNTEAAQIPGINIFFVTMDLPFAQARWCGGAGVDRVTTLSDYHDRSFGPAHGTWDPSRGLHVRAVFVVDRDDRIRHVEYVREVANEPDYAAALAAAHRMM